MNTYVGFMRGINVGGKGIVKMSELTSELDTAGFVNTQTYIQSGNVIFDSDAKDTDKLASHIKSIIQQQFNMTTEVVVFSKQDWRDIVRSAPSWWGDDMTWKHNLLIMTGPHTMSDVMKAIGDLKPDIEIVQPGKGVLYQSMSRALFGRTTTGKLASNPIYKHMTVRNFNTATKILSLIEK